MNSICCFLSRINKNYKTVQRIDFETWKNYHFRQRPFGNVSTFKNSIENLEAAELLTTAGIDVVMNRCIKIEYERLFNRSDK